MTSPILSSSGQLLCEKKAKFALWKKYYSDLLSKPITEPPKDLIETASSTFINTAIDCEEPSQPEVSRTIAKLRNGKAPGICGIPGELLKHGGPTVASWLTQVFKGIWASGHIPHNWRKGIILPFYKGKGSRQECKNYRGITLLSCPGKVFGNLLAWVKDKLLSVRRTEKSGFTPQISTVDRMALLNLLLQGRREHSRPLWIAYVDLCAAFDSVDCNALWLLLRTVLASWHITQVGRHVQGPIHEHSELRASRGGSLRLVSLQLWCLARLYSHSIRNSSPSGLGH